MSRVIGDRLTIPVMDERGIENKLKRLYKKGLLVNKNKRNLVKLNEFKMEMGEFFDVCSWTCPSAYFQEHCKTENCDGFHLACKCDVKSPKRATNTRTQPMIIRQTLRQTQNLQ